MSDEEPKPWAAYAVIGLLCAAGVMAVVIGSRNPPSAPAPPATASAVPPAGDTLGIEDLVVGSGPQAAAGDTVTVQYVGTLLNGTEFDDSRKHGSSGFKFQLGQGRVIAGWDQGLVGMKVGGKRRLVIPPSLGYGERGAGALIPPDSTLVFVVDLEEALKP